MTVSTTTDAQARSVVTVAGALDLASRDVLQTAGRAALDDSPGLVLDLSGVTFIDSTGLGVLVELAGDAQDVGRTFALRDPSERVSRILTISGLLDQWPVESQLPSSG